MTIPQVQGWLKPILTIFLGSLAVGLWNANQDGELEGWDMLPEVAYDASFTAFLAVVAWLGLRSPLSAAAQAEKQESKQPA